jgi:hypothetical protein
MHGAFLSTGEIRMLDYFLTSADGWAVFKVVAVLVPVLAFMWVVMTVMAPH